MFSPVELFFYMLALAGGLLVIGLALIIVLVLYAVVTRP